MSLISRLDAIDSLPCSYVYLKIINLQNLPVAYVGLETSVSSPDNKAGFQQVVSYSLVWVIHF